MILDDLLVGVELLEEIGARQRRNRHVGRLRVGHAAEPVWTMESTQPSAVEGARPRPQDPVGRSPAAGAVAAPKGRPARMQRRDRRLGRPEITSPQRAGTASWGRPIRRARGRRSVSARHRERVFHLREGGDVGGDAPTSTIAVTLRAGELREVVRARSDACTDRRRSAGWGRFRPLSPSS